MNIELLQSQHHALHALAEKLLLAVADDGNPQPLGTLRWQFARELMAHLALEDHIFYPSMKRRPDDPLRETAAQLQVEVAPLAQLFSQYMAQWNDDRIARDWRSFCRETRDMIEAIMRRIDKENRLLKALSTEAALKAPQIRRAG
ncbi:MULTISPECIES: hemerythrin domain-containing protein [Sphingobium]|uniref:hemerythrin domain-containing protein n=1 Tax=Sphingobium sp. MI1205 TaxID=407020 RepID=UPI00076FE1C4|nr:hemerythrin domain-containing protein [Sphingobium sp. MI1205]AMK19172.1 hemerythrin HHE cation binding domain-containing protein [Sphingobium sp. MI1205]